MQFFIHKPPRKPGIDGSWCIIKTLDGSILECTFDNEDGFFYYQHGWAKYACCHDMIQWWAYKDSLLAHLESEEE